MADAEVSLNCFVFGDTVSQQVLFPVVIAGGSKIGELRNKIKEHNPQTFDWVDTRKIILWKISRPSADVLKELESVRSPGELGRSVILNPLSRVSTAFPASLVEDHLHIIVQLPESKEETYFPLSHGLTSLL